MTTPLATEAVAGCDGGDRQHGIVGLEPDEESVLDMLLGVVAEHDEVARSQLPAQVPAQVPTQVPAQIPTSLKETIATTPIHAAASLKATVSVDDSDSDTNSEEEGETGDESESGSGDSSDVTEDEEDQESPSASASEQFEGSFGSEVPVRCISPAFLPTPPVARKPSVPLTGEEELAPPQGPRLERKRSASFTDTQAGPVAAAKSTVKVEVCSAVSGPMKTLRKRSTTSSKLEGPSSAQARSWKAILEEEKAENASVIKSFGNYRLGQMLGKGGYGKVYEGLNTKTGALVAIKEVNMTGRDFVLEELPLILAEIKLHQTLDHPNIVRYLDFHRQGDRILYIILELLEGGSLYDALKRYSFFPEPLVAKYAFQILQGIKYLHDKDILHRDIKGANVLMTRDGHCKLADFGLALHLNSEALQQANPLGTSYWMAPEIFCMESPDDITKASDVWSFGCTVMELLTGRPPYHKMKPVQALFQILETEFPPFPPNASPDLIEFLKLCFCKDPQKRASVDDLLNHGWLLRHTVELRKRVEPTDLLGLTPETLLSRSDTSIVHILRPLPEEQLHASELSSEKRMEIFRRLQVKNELTSATVVELLRRRQLCGSVDEKQLERLVAAVRMLEKNFVTSGEKLARLFYGDKLAIERFTSGCRGVLLAKKGAEKKSRWHKRWILLKDNFLFLYEAADQTIEPTDVILLSQPMKIIPSAERDVGKKFCFQIHVESQKPWFFAAANGQFMLKWLSDLSAIKNWYDDEVSTAPPLPQPLSPRRVDSLTHSKSEEKSFHSDDIIDDMSPRPQAPSAQKKIASGEPTHLSRQVLASIASDGTIPVQKKLNTSSSEVAHLAHLMKRTDNSEPLVIDLAVLRKQKEKDEKKLRKVLKKDSGAPLSARLAFDRYGKASELKEEEKRRKSSDHNSSLASRKETVSSSKSSDNVSSMANDTIVQPEPKVAADPKRTWGREALKRALSMSEPGMKQEAGKGKKQSSLKRELSSKRLSSMLPFRPRARTSSKLDDVSKELKTVEHGSDKEPDLRQSADLSMYNSIPKEESPLYHLSPREDDSPMSPELLPLVEPQVADEDKSAVVFLLPDDDDDCPLDFNEVPTNRSSSEPLLNSELVPCARALREPSRILREPSATLSAPKAVVPVVSSVTSDGAASEQESTTEEASVEAVSLSEEEGMEPLNEDGWDVESLAKALMLSDEVLGAEPEEVPDASTDLVDGSSHLLEGLTGHTDSSMEEVPAIAQAEVSIDTRAGEDEEEDEREEEEDGEVTDNDLADEDVYETFGDTTSSQDCSTIDTQVTSDQVVGSAFADAST